MDYKLLQEFVQKYFVVHELSAVENSFSTYVCYTPDGLFWLNLYPDSFCVGEGKKRQLLNKKDFKLPGVIGVLFFLTFIDHTTF